MLFTPLKVGAITLSNRILMAPLTRARSDLAHMPNDLMAQYYAQRASAGLIVTECTMIAPNTSAFITEPGIYSPEQVLAWKKITDAVHAKGGKIVMQIWHAGRAAHPLLNHGAENVAPSAVAIGGDIQTPSGKVAHAVPHALTTAEISELVHTFAEAAKHAVAAGFDGVEVHGANGYLIDQFLRDGANRRSDTYGGTMENRARFLFEVLTAVSAAIGSDRVGLRLSPLNSFNSMIDSDPIGLTEFLAKRLNDFNLAYLHLMRADFLQQQTGDVMTVARAHYKGVLIGNMGYNSDEAQAAMLDKKLDAVAFGTSFLANPDLPERIQAKAALNEPDQATFYSPGAKGYTDYPRLLAA
ncbi:MAG: alkene reductase [Rhodoferax sp.]|uniref:alkene reductase n=1 Tax=Rhodoferax sp. TaxID=50421 RepID=UPI00261684BB|nr:alkene reductase [Rhodoferax sp.]MDD2882508.1 alkene reductase [Rhodoferax sp.]